MTEDTRVRDAFDRLLGAIDGLPDVVKSKPSTITTVLPIIGNVQTYVVQTYRDKDEGSYIAVQMVDAEGRARIVLPPKVAAAIYRQREALVKAGRRQRGRDRWDRLTTQQRQAQVARLRKPNKEG